MLKRSVMGALMAFFTLFTSTDDSELSPPNSPAPAEQTGQFVKFNDCKVSHAEIVGLKCYEMVTRVLAAFAKKFSELVACLPFRMAEVNNAKEHFESRPKFTRTSNSQILGVLQGGHRSLMRRLLLENPYIPVLGGSSGAGHPIQHYSRVGDQC